MEYLSTKDLLPSYRKEDTWPEPLLLEVVAVNCPAGTYDFQRWMNTNKFKKKTETDKTSTVQFQPASHAEKDNFKRLIDLLREDKVGHQYSKSLLSDTA